MLNGPEAGSDTYPSGNPPCTFCSQTCGIDRYGIAGAPSEWSILHAWHPYMLHGPNHAQKRLPQLASSMLPVRAILCAIRSRVLHAGSPLAAQRVVSSISKQRHRQQEKRSIRRLGCHTIEKLPWVSPSFLWAFVPSLHKIEHRMYLQQTMRTKALRHQWPDLRLIVYRLSTESPAQIAHKPTIRNITAVPPNQKINRPTPMASASNRSNPNP